MPKVVKRNSVKAQEPFEPQQPYGRAKYVCAKCKAVHWWKFDRCQNPKCRHTVLERVKNG